MSDSTLIVPTPAPANPTPSPTTNTLSVPPLTSRPNSAGSTRSNSSRHGRSGHSSGRTSASISRSNSNSSKGPSENGDKVKKSGMTTTISGGTSLGLKEGEKPSSAPRGRGKGGRKNEGKCRDDQGPTSAPPKPANAIRDGPENKDSRRASTSAARRPNPISTAPAPSASQTSFKPISPDSAAQQSASSDAPRSIHAHVSAPRTAMEAAVDAATKKHNGDALTSLQKMISDLKSIPPGSLPPSGPSPIGSRSTSGAKEVKEEIEVKSAKSRRESTDLLQQERKPSVTNPVAIPSSSSGKKLKADAPSFTPSFQSISPGSALSVSPGPAPPSFVPPQPASRSASLGSQPGVRRHSSSSTGHAASFGAMATSPISAYANSLPHFPLASLGQYHHQLAVHAEAENEDLSPLCDAQYQQQQLLAAQQYQQLQLLQAQIAANQLAQQQVQQQQPSMGSFMAPRFQALAAQRAAAQQQQQALQLAQVQQLFELQQQHLLQAQEAQTKAAAQASLQNPPPVFEEDSPEPKHSSLGPTGRPQLAPSFTFGSKRRESAEARASISPPAAPAPVVVNRSEGIGGAQATGLAGLAARAHKRTGSELTPAMQQQLELQNQIEALQAKQKALLQEDLANQGNSALSQINSAFANKQTPTQTVNKHRRVQSSLPSATVGDPFALALEALEVGDALPKQTVRGFSEMPPPPVPVTGAGHSRRHSVNVFAKAAGVGSGFGSFGGDIPEDGFPNGTVGHHRSGSRSGLESGNWRSTVQANPAVSDLAAAQAQLQSLAQFRAAAGGGHAKMASFALPNMLPNLLAATTLSTPAGQSLWQQQQAFQMQLQQTSQGPQRKSLFAPYLPQASLPPLLQAGKLVVGILRVNKKNRSDAYVATDVLEADIYICGSKDRNRALEGDIVAVELLDVDEVWSTKKDKEEKKRKKEENAAYDLKPATAKKLEKKKDDVEVEGQGLTLFDDEEVNDETKPTYAGHVVAVVERMPGQLFSGQLGVLRPSSAATKEKQEIERREREGDRARREEPEARPKIVWFKPTDKRVPLIAIPTEQAPDDFVDHPDAYADRLFVATIKRWPITSLHPFGTLVEELGPIGDPEVETSALLKDCNFPTEEFSELTTKCIPPLPWSIPEREYEIREDLRDERVFTIDPLTARDLDDALSIKENLEGTYTVGVHIADVSYFVKSNTAMDREARKRATSVYLVQRAVPMLPPLLSEQLCSLQPDVERLTFSASFVIDKEANVVEKTFGRSIIKSCAKLAYSDAQAVIRGGNVPQEKVASSHPASGVEKDIRALNDLAVKLRAKRLESGAMVSNNKMKVSFQLDEEGKPVDVDSYRRIEANSLVEEFMLLANMSVAQVIANGLPEQSLLRRHEAPIERRLDGFVSRAQKLGFAMDSTSAGTLQRSFDAVKDKDAAMCLELLKRKAMQRAKYFCTGMLDIAKYSHWALNAPLYTHFTSPIRRYADVLVHRMLDACLSSPNPNEVKFLMDRDQVAKCAQQCNMKKQSAKLAEEQSIHLYLCMLIHDLTEKYGPVVREARVTGVLDAAFDVVIPEFGIEKRVHVDKMPLDNAVFDEHRDQLSLYWTKTDVLSFLASMNDDPHLLKIRDLAQRLASGKASAQIKDESALFDDGARTLASTSKQYEKSKLQASGHASIAFDGLRTTAAGHLIQDVRELMRVPVIVTADVGKSPPVLVVYACNPYAS